MAIWSQKAALDDGKFVRHRGQRGARQRNLVVIVGHFVAVEEMHRVIHQPVIDAGDGQRRDRGGLGFVGKRLIP